MLQRPFFVETKIRIKLPNDTIWEGRFTPKETLQDVLNIFKNVKFCFKQKNSRFSLILQYLVIPDLNGYLFQTPPFKKMNQKDLAKNLEELESVPSGMFHYALEDKSNLIFYFDKK